MSSKNRKIGFYTFEFINNETNEKLKGKELENYFNNLITYITNKNFQEKKAEITESNKFYYLGYHELKNIVNLIFESAKTGHRPSLVDEETGEKRPNPKDLTEGDDELTHLSAKFDHDDDLVLVALEERLHGVTIKQISSYFNRFIREHPVENQYLIQYSIIPCEEFLEALKRFSRITVGKVIIDKEKVGSDFLGLTGFGKYSIRDDMELIFKAPYSGTIEREFVKMFHKVMKSDENIKRIRLEGESLSEGKITLDTAKMQLNERVNVNISEDTGVVDTKDVFEKLNDGLMHV